MEKVTLYIKQASSGEAPAIWYMYKRIGIQRLYYIKSGSGRIMRSDGVHIPFVPGKIYVFPYNFRQSFVTDSDNPIDHLYFDFFSSPPIIHSEPLIYNVPDGSALHHMVKLIEAALPKKDENGRWSPYRHPANFGKIVAAPSGSENERFAIIYNLFETLLMMLSCERELPFSSDEMVFRALEHIHRDYANPISISELADEAGYEVNHFIRRFKKVMGVTPYRYLCSLRQLLAGTMIQDGVTAEVAAATVGYSSASTLSRAIRITKKSEK